MADESQNITIPTYRDFLFPVLQALDESDGSLAKREVDSKVIESEQLNDEQIAVAYPVGSAAKGSKVLHRIAFARSSLKLFGAVNNSERGVWTITTRGRELLAAGEAEVRRADSDVRKELAARRALSGANGATEAVLDSESEPELAAVLDIDSDAWRRDLIETLLSMTPRAFERLCAQLLREAGCEDVAVTKYVGDEGLDGVGTLRMGLLSFPVYFQAKRYTGTVGPEKVRELRGALFGRADKGILITTGRFGTAARQEAARAGAPIDLIDGDRLCDLMLEYRLGVAVRPTVDRESLARFDA